jgi:EAL domain-containing protein (putative c-di-GMP-specific phosphodiesterase class I)
MKILVVEDDRQTADAIAAGLSGPDRTILVAHDVAMAELVVEHEEVAAIVSDIRLTGPFRFEGLDFIDFVAHRRPRCSVVVISGAVTAEIEAEALRRGAAAVFQKPFDLELLERHIPDGDRRDRETVITIPSLDDVIDGHVLITPVFQPIRRLENDQAEVVAYEALCRVETDSLLRRPDLLFAYAARMNRVLDLELATIARTFETGRNLSAEAMLFLNMHPAALLDGDRLAAALAAEADAHGIPLERVVLELTEQHPIPVHPRVAKTFASLRERGVRFAFDDVGSAYSHLPHIDLVRPDFLKVSQDFGTDFERDPTRSKLVKNLLALARDFESELIVEGIESAATADAARALGVPLGQGYYFGRPQPPAAECVDTPNA